MNTIKQYLEQATLKRSTGVYAMILLVALFALAACGSDDTAAVQSCVYQTDCELGYSCNFQDECVQVSCDNCANDPSLICLITPDHPQGTCSSPECTSHTQCDEGSGETCNNGVCAIGGCNNSDANCPDGQECNFADQCVPKETETEDCGGCEADETCNTSTGLCEGGSVEDCGGCEADETCNTSTGECEGESTEDCGGCEANETCNTGTGECEADAPVDACGGSCTADEICNNGTCVANTCPPGSQTPETCADDPVYNLFDPDGCYCAECLDDSSCDTAAGESCTANGECRACNESCDVSDGADACSGDGFFCIDECCIECTGNSDCTVSGEVCVDGACAPPPNCTNDPTVCRAGTVCEGGTCKAPAAGAGCSSAMDCFPGTCNMQTNTCEDGAGPGAIFECSPACGSGQNCMLGTCTQGCIPLLGQCPNDGFCFPTSILPPEGVCI